MFDDLNDAVRSLVDKSKEINKGHCVVRMPRKFGETRRSEDERHVKLHEQRIIGAKADRNEAYDALEVARQEWEECQSVLARCRRLGTLHPDEISQEDLTWMNEVGGKLFRFQSIA